MRYVLDTGVLANARDYYYDDIFPSFWRKMEKLAQNGDISSVAEVKEELARFRGEQEHLLGWLQDFLDCPEPSEAEWNFAQRLLAECPDMLLKAKVLENADSFADPLVIARAYVTRATVVTTERSSKDARGNIQVYRKIPDVCERYGVPCVSPHQFLQAQNWSF